MISRERLYTRGYLEQRRQYVSYGGVHSDISQCLFILYSNDLPIALKNCRTILFADDATIYATGTNLLDIFTRINTDLDVMNDWFRANTLSANP